MINGKRLHKDVHQAGKTGPSQKVIGISCNMQQESSIVFVVTHLRGHMVPMVHACLHHYTVFQPVHEITTMNRGCPQCIDFP